MGRSLFFLYGVVSYLIFFATFLYLVGFIANFFVPKTIDSGVVGGFWPSLIINLLLLTVFALQHSVMARPGFKRWLTRIVPVAIERSTYVLLSSLALILLCYFWQPMTDVIWQVTGETARMIIWGVFLIGVLVVLLSTFMIGHFELFGLTQVLRNYLGQGPLEPKFRSPGLYKLVRHPIMTGFIITVWATPDMTVGHFVFALMSTLYILVALIFEERDLVDSLGAPYETYRKDVPQLVPFLKPRRKE